MLLQFQLKITMDLLKDNEQTHIAYKEKQIYFKKGMNDIFKRDKINYHTLKISLIFSH